MSSTESSLYGVPLATLLENDQKVKPNTSTPLFMQAVRIVQTFYEEKGVILTHCNKNFFQLF